MKISSAFILVGCIGSLIGLTIPASSMAAPARAKAQRTRAAASKGRASKASRRITPRERKRRKAAKRRAAARSVPAAPDTPPPSVGASTKRFEGPRASDSINPAGPSAVPSPAGPATGANTAPISPGLGPGTGTPMPLVPVKPGKRMITPAQTTSVDGLLRIESARFDDWSPSTTAFQGDWNLLRISVRNLGARKVKVSCAVEVSESTEFSIIASSGTTQSKTVTPTSGSMSFWVMTKTNSEVRAIKAVDASTPWRWRNCVIDRIQ